MDPNAALEKLRALSKRIDNVEDDGALGPLAEEMAQVWDGLDAWLSKGGVLPEAWKR